MQEYTTEQLNKQIGQLFSESLKVSNPIQSLHSIREKMQTRGYQSFDKEDILNELGQLQHLLGKLHSNLLQIDNLLKHA
jgi:uncharacterized Rmd1/YagE family protein